MTISRDIIEKAIQGVEAKKLTEQEMYIEQLEKKIESLETISREILDERDFIRLFGHQYYGDKGKDNE